MNSSRLTKVLFMYDYGYCENNWSSSLKLMLNKLGMSDYYELHECIDLDDFNVNNCRIIQEAFRQNILKKPKLRTYVTFKDTLAVEDYVIYCKFRHHISLIAQFRMGILPLMIETGRYQNVKAIDRKCNFCINEVEDEFHFLLKCSKYVNFRNTLFDKASVLNSDFRDLDDFSKFSFIVKFMWKDFVIYLEKSWSMRKSLLYNSV